MGEGKEYREDEVCGGDVSILGASDSESKAEERLCAE